ncbi:MAG: DUF1684 domain-containing protein [Bacteroidota bacterium]
MKELSLIIFVQFFIVSIFGQSTYSDSLQKERERHQIEFVSEVLDSTEKAHFKGICYFEIDTNLIVDATFKREKGKKFQMPMSKERIVYYQKYGTLTFIKNDTLCVLTVYENLNLKKKKGYEDYLFLPFKDKTSGTLTYGGGRYLDLRKSKQSTWKIDFNLAYHPYCAYSERYSCPLVPSENKIPVEIKAGECYQGSH